MEKGHETEKNKAQQWVSGETEPHLLLGGSDLLDAKRQCLSLVLIELRFYLSELRVSIETQRQLRGIFQSGISSVRSKRGHQVRGIPHQKDAPRNGLRRTLGRAQWDGECFQWIGLDDHSLKVGMKLRHHSFRSIE